MRRAVMLALLASVAVEGCRRPGRAPAADRASSEALRLLPPQTVFVVGADITRIRAAPITGKLGALRVVFGPLAKQIDALAAGTGFDQIESVVIGGISLESEMAIIIRGRGFDEGRLTAQARAAFAGDELIERKYGKRTLWSARTKPENGGVLLDAETLVMATSGWIERIVDLADGGGRAPSAASNQALAGACAEVSASPLWGAGVLPDETRKVLETDLQLRSIGSMRRVTLAVELGETLNAKLAVDFGDVAQAEGLAEDLATLIDRQRREKRDLPYYQALFKGLTEYADGPTFRAELRLQNDVVVQLAETTARLANWRKPPSELPAPTAHALTMKPDWLSPPPTTVTMSEVRSYDAWDRRTHALFEVVNRTDKPVVPEVVIRYRDSDDKKLDERQCLVPMLVLLAHESAGCDPGVPANASSGIYTIRTAPPDRAAAFASKSRITLKVVGARLEEAQGAVQWLAGQVKNTTTSIVRDARVHATFYDAERRIVGYGDVVATRNLAPGASAPFRLPSGPVFAAAKSFSAIGYSIVGPR